MKKNLLPAVVILFSTMANLAMAQPKPTTEQQIKKLLSQMTIEEKVGQMTQLSLDMVCQGEPYKLTEPMAIDAAKLKTVINKYHVGSILNVGTYAHPKEEWFGIIQAIKNEAAATRLHIPVLYGIDAIHGTNYTMGSTLFPQQIGLACTWNRKLTEELCAISAYETRASSIPWTFSPVLDLGRNPVWPRVWEGFGEDVYLSAQLGIAAVKGFQGNNMADKYKVASCLKHYTGYGVPLSGKDRTPAFIPERQLQEYYIPGFKAAIDAGAATIMVNSGEINGQPAHSSYHLLTQVLRNQLGFKGFAVSDWEDIKYLCTRYHIVATEKEATKLAVMAGIDMSMVPNDFSFTTELIELVKEGQVPISRINEAVSRILKVKIELGLFNTMQYPAADYPKFGSQEFSLKSLQGASESLVLLKNSNNTLPLATTAKVLVTGPTANTMRSLNGGWTYTWQGERTDEFNKNLGNSTIVDAISKLIGKQNVVYQPGVTFAEATNIPAAVAAAQQVDAIVLCLGENSYTEDQGNTDDLTLTPPQQQLAAALATTGKPIILILAQGRPCTFNNIESSMNAVLYAPLPGNQGGNAIANVLFGNTNPSGKLCLTYPRYPNALNNYDYKPTEIIAHIPKRYNPQYEFGHGLSYTSFSYSNLHLSASTIKMGGNITIAATITNTGNRAGKEVAQLYIGDLVASITPSIKRLRGFDKVELQAGQSQQVSFTINTKDLAFVGLNDQWITEPGTFRIMLGGLQQNFEVVK